MVNTWWAATVIAITAGVVGFFTVQRGAAFAAHALPNGAFAGAAGATLVGVSTIAGLSLFSVAGALAIGALGRRARHDVATALTIVAMLAVGSLFLSIGSAYAPQIYALLFGQVAGVSDDSLLAMAFIGAACLAAVVLLWRPLMLTSVSPDLGLARGVRDGAVGTAFLVIVALATTAAVPVVGALLVFSLLVAPAAAARCVTRRPAVAVAVGVAVALITVWAAVAVFYLTSLPVGFVVGGLGAVWYTAGRLYARAKPQ